MIVLAALGSSSSLGDREDPDSPRAYFSMAEPQWRAPGADAPPVWSSDGREILFQQTRESGIAQIWAIRSDGTGLRRVTDGSFRAGHPDACARDDRLALVKEVGGTLQVAVLDPESGSTSAVTSSPFDKTSPTVSPDCRQVAFLALTDRPAGRYDLRVVDVTTGDETTLLSSIRYLGWPRWSPDGRWILFHRELEGHPNHIWRVRPDGSEAQPLTHGDHGDYWSADLSRDGGRWVYSFSRRNQLEWGANADLWLLETATGECRPLRGERWHEHGGRLSPDGRQVAYWDDRSGYNEIFVLDIESGTSRQLTYQPAGELTGLARRQGARKALELAQSEPGTMTRFSDPAMARLLDDRARESRPARPELARLYVREYPDSQRARASLARELFRDGELSEAEALYRTLFADSPADPRFGPRLSALLLLEEMTGEDLTTLETFDRLPEGPVNQLGYALMRQGQLLVSLDVLAWNTTAHPESANAWDSLGESLFWLGELESAARAYRRARQLDPANVNAERFLDRIRRAQAATTSPTVGAPPCPRPAEHREESGPGVPTWATVLEWEPDPSIVKDAETRRRIVATAAPWRVLHEPSGVELLLVPPGSFLRGAAPDDPFDRENERPQHSVEITRPYYLGRFEVTNAQMRRFRPEHTSGSFYRDETLTLDEDDMPAVDVSWLDATAFAEHYGFRLPTEAEWEYAARAGVETRYPWGNNPDEGEGWGNGFNEAVKVVIPEMDWDAFAWDDGFVVSSPAGSFRPNNWGFHDLFGNAWEWCRDLFRDEQYQSWALGSIDAVALGEDGDRRTLRGGGWGNAPRGSGIPYRFGMDPSDRFDGNGFRVARSLTGEHSSTWRAPVWRRLTDWPGNENGAEFSPDGEWIVFDAVVDGQADIYRLHLESGTTRRVTATPELDRQPTFSADGQRIAFESVREGVRGLWSVNVEGGEPKPLFVREGVTPIGPDYSINGDLVFTLVEPDPSVTYGWVTPWVLPADGGEARPITRGGDEWWARWGPQGQWLYYFLGSVDRIEAVNVTTGEVRPVTGGLNRGWRPAVSPDGRIAFLSNPDGSLWFQPDRPDAVPVQLTRGIGGEDRPDFSPDGSSIVVSSDRNRSQVVALDLETGERQTVGTGRRPQALADGSVAFLTEEGDDSALRVAAPGSSESKRLTIPIRGIERFELSPDGTIVALTANGGGPRINMDLYVGALDGSPLRRLTRLPGSGADSPVWCSEHQVAYTSYQEDLPFRQVFLLDLGSGETTVLTDTDSSKRLTGCADDGARITYRLVADKSGVYSAHRRVPGEVYSERHEVDGREGSVSPDGTRLAYVDSEGGRTDVFVREPGGEAIRVTDDPLVEDGVRWLPDGSGLVFSTRSPNRDLWLLTGIDED